MLATTESAVSGSSAKSPSNFCLSSRMPCSRRVCIIVQTNGAADELSSGIYQAAAGLDLGTLYKTQSLATYICIALLATGVCGALDIDQSVIVSVT